MDDLTPEQRRKNMQAIKSKDTSIELALRKALWHKGIRYRKNYKNLPGKPDIAVTKTKIAVFCDSDFWHGYDWENRSSKIKSNRDYWIPKIERNMKRDREVTEALEKAGWTVLRFWEFQIKKELDACVEAVCAEDLRRRKGNSDSSILMDDLIEDGLEAGGAAEF